MRIAFRCQCSRLIAEIEDDMMYFARQGFVVVCLPPTYIRCAQCERWYKFNERHMIEPSEPADREAEIGPRCIQCGASLLDESGVKQEICEKCGQPQTLAKTYLKSTR